MLLHILQKKTMLLFTEDGTVRAAPLLGAEISGGDGPSVTTPTAMLRHHSPHATDSARNISALSSN